MEEFKIDKAIPISSDVSSTIESHLVVTGVPNKIRDLTVNLDIDHTLPADLSIILFSPSGKGVSLANNRGTGNNFKNLTLSDNADVAIADSQPKVGGTYRPEGMLSTFRGEDPNGTWKLRITDLQCRDCGSLNRWSILIDNQSIQNPSYTIDVNFLGGLSATQMSVFSDAAKRWSEVIHSPLTLEISAKGEVIDGPGKVLGQAGPRSIKPGTLFPDTGEMTFDAGDLASIEADGSLFNVILHEMGHVIGIGRILWEAHNYLEGIGTANPLFVGPKAMHEYGVLLGKGPTKVPVANMGGPGTANSHWREETFGNELMSGFADTGLLPLSRITIAMLEDLGYQVDYDAADTYVIPSKRMLAAIMATAKKRDFHVSRPVCEGLTGRTNVDRKS